MDVCEKTGLKKNAVKIDSTYSSHSLTLQFFCNIVLLMYVLLLNYRLSFPVITSATLKFFDSNVTLPWKFSKLRWSSTNYSFLQSVAWSSRYATQRHHLILWWVVTTSRKSILNHIIVPFELRRVIVVWMPFLNCSLRVLHATRVKPWRVPTSLLTVAPLHPAQDG